MSKSTKSKVVTVGAKEVRAWATEQGIATGSRGRLDPAARAYEAAHPGTKYVAQGPRETTLPIFKVSSRGAHLPRPEAFPTSEVRKMLGQPEGRKGRLSSADLAKAADLVMQSRAAK